MQDWSANDFLVPWHTVDQQSAAAWKKELARELPRGHVLLGREARFVARRQDRDDFLVALENDEVAWVHLTWSVEKDPRWSAAQIYGSFEEWRAQEMVPDNDEWRRLEGDDI